MLLGLFILSLRPQFKGFALTMFLLGIIDAAVLMTVFYQADAKMQTQIDQFNKESIVSATAGQIDRTEGALRTFFTVKVVYAVAMIVLVLMLSKLALSPLLSGILVAVIVHLALAITIDNFGEQYTKHYHTTLLTSTP